MGRVVSMSGIVAKSLVCGALLVACSAEAPAPAPSRKGGSTGNNSGGSGGGSTASGGTTGTGGAPNAAGTGGSSGSGGATTPPAATGGTTGTTDGGAPGTGGTTGGGTTDGGAEAGAPSSEYPPPPRAMNLMLMGRAGGEIKFSATAADPAAKNFHAGNYAVFNGTAAVVQKKLVIGLHGIGNGAGPGGALSWAAGRGFHVIGIDYANDKGGDGGNPYLETWVGEDKGAALDVSPANSVMNRVKTGLAYLQKMDPGADWAYYLNADGSVRWNDVIAFGYSYGGQTVVAATKYVALHRGIAVSAPSLDPATAPWMMTMPNVTPPSRSYMISGTMDGGHMQHIKAATALGWVGMNTNATTGTPPYNNSHVLEVNDGHSEFCSRKEFDVICDHVFGTLKM